MLTKRIIPCLDVKNGQTVKGVNFENLNDEQILLQNTNLVERGLLEHYNTILKSNAKMNDDKANRLSISIKYSIIFFLLLNLATIFLLIITR